MRAEVGVGGGEVAGVAAGKVEEFGVAREGGGAEGGKAGLPSAEDLAHAADLEVAFGDEEAVGRFEHGAKACGGIGGARVGEEDAEGRARAPADAATELVELREAEAIGVFNDHERGIGNIDADFDDGGADEGVKGAGAEAGHHGVALGVVEATVECGEGEVLEPGLREEAEVGGDIA